MRVGIVGTGRMGKARAIALSKIPDVELGWICSRKTERAEEFIKQQDGGVIPNGIEVVDDYQTALQKPDVPAIIITGPNSAHHQAVLLAFKAGKHVFIEYPPAVTAKEASSLMDLARSCKRSYHVGLTHLFGGKHQRIAELCGGGHELGNPVSYQLVFCSGNPISRWYDNDDLSGGMFVSSLYHYIDEAIDYFGDYASFHATYRCERGEDGIIRGDVGSIQIEFASKCTAQITYARGMAQPGIGGRSTIIFENGYITEIDGETKVLTSSGSESLSFTDRDAVLDDTAAFIEQIREENIYDGTAEHAQKALVLAEQAQKTACGTIG